MRGTSICVLVLALLPCRGATASIPIVPDGSGVTASPRSVTATFAAPSAPSEDNGYSYATITIRYRFLVCGADLSIAYAVDPGTLATSTSYWFSGQRLSTSAPAPRLSALTFSADIMLLDHVESHFEEQEAQASPTLPTCSGPVRNFARLEQLFGPHASTAQIQNLLDSLTLRVAALPITLRNSRIEHEALSSTSPTSSPGTGGYLPGGAATETSTSREYLRQLEHSQKALADFKARRAEYEADLRAAQAARMEYEQQYMSGKDH